MRSIEQQMASTRECYREQGRKARRDGLTIADCPCFPLIGPRPLGYVPHGTEWLIGWREQDELETAGAKLIAQAERREADDGR